MYTQTHEKYGQMPTWAKAAGYVAAAGAGAGLMYLLDPNRGNARRALMRDRAFAMARSGSHEIGKHLLDLEHRAQGAMAEVRGRLAPEQPVDDRKLEARIHTKLGRAASDPHAVRVMSLSGHVVLGGSAPTAEIEKIVRAVGQTPGVKSVENRLAEGAAEAPVPKMANGALVPTLLAVGSGILAAVQSRIR